jgi:Ser/Thr protein kinase RdoA (MazF antagonist)
MTHDTTLVGLLRAEFGLPALGATPGGRGAIGQVWRMRVQGRPDVGVKLLPEQPPEAVVANEVAHARRMAGHGVAVAESIADRRGRYVTAVEGGWVRVSEWIDGTAPDPADPLTPQRLGEVLGRMHRHTVPAPGRLSRWYAEPPPMARLAELVTAAERGDARWRGRLETALPNMHRLSRIVAEPSVLVWCHRDLHPGNVLLTPRGGFAVLDWECLGPADPGQELASVLLHWFADRTGVLGPQMDAFVEAYRSAGGTGRLTSIQDFAMHLATRLNFLALQLEAPKDPHAQAEIEETVQYLPTTEVLAQCLDRVTNHWS